MFETSPLFLIPTCVLDNGVTQRSPIATAPDGEERMEEREKEREKERKKERGPHSRSIEELELFSCLLSLFYLSSAAAADRPKAAGSKREWGGWVEVENDPYLFESRLNS